MRLMLEPVDVALFRDPRPFTAAEFARAETVGIVPPQTAIYGTLRHMLLERWKLSYGRFHAGEAPKEIGAVLGTREQFGTLEMNGPWLEWESEGGVEEQLAWPADAVGVEGPGFATGGYLAPGRIWADSNLPEGLESLTAYRPEEEGWRECDSETKVVVVENGVLGADRLENYLVGGGHDGVDSVKASRLVGHELRVGIARSDESYRAKEGMLFTVKYLRARDDAGGRAVFGVEVEDGGALGYLGEGAVTVGLGGERRPFRVGVRTKRGSVVDEGVRRRVEMLLARQCAEGRVDFRLLLVTRAAFRAGWMPDLFARGSVEDGRMKYRLVSAAVGRPTALGSWDVSKKGRAGARAVLRYAPEGSVYFVRAEGPPGMSADEIAHEVMEKFWWRKTLIGDPDRVRLGQGLTLVGGIPNV